MGYSVEGQKFNELEELLITYLEPLIRNVKEITDSQKFKSKQRAEMLEIIRQQSEVTRRSSYGICPSDHPTKFYFVYHNLGGSRPHHEHIIVKAEGFLFREKTYHRLVDMTDGFKRGEVKKAAEAKKKRQEQKPQQQRQPSRTATNVTDERSRGSSSNNQPRTSQQQQSRRPDHRGGVGSSSRSGDGGHRSDRRRY